MSEPQPHATISADIVAATRSYERWLGEQIELVPADLRRRHAKMRESAFACFRATHYRWLERIVELAPELDAPVLAAVGDLHAENFGTWRDAEGRLVWGINDLDESERLPYTFDLARLATSAALAARDEGLELALDDACRAILRGYRRALGGGGSPFVLAGAHRRLDRMVARTPVDAAGWWTQILALPAAEEELPPAAREALAFVLPRADWSYEVRRRVAGVGSLGHRRLVAVGECDGAPAARELKELSPPAGRWLGRPASTGLMDLRGTVRSPDPLWGVHGSWLARRVAPDCIKLDLAMLKRRTRAHRLFEWMGAETANLHLATHAAIPAVLEDLERRQRGWLEAAAHRLAKAARKDHERWCRDGAD